MLGRILIIILLLPIFSFAEEGITNTQPSIIQRSVEIEDKAEESEEENTNTYIPENRRDDKNYQDRYEVMYDRDYHDEKKDRDWYFGFGLGGLFGLLYRFDTNSSLNSITTGNEIKLRFKNKKSSEGGGFYMQYSLSYRGVGIESNDIEISNYTSVFSNYATTNTNTLTNTYKMLSLMGVDLGFYFPKDLNFGIFTASFAIGLGYFSYLPTFTFPDKTKMPYHLGHCIRLPFSLEFNIAEKVLGAEIYATPSFYIHKSDMDDSLRYRFMFSPVLDAGITVWVYFK